MRQSASPIQAVARSISLAFFLVLVACVLELALQRLFPYPFLLLFLAAVIVSAWHGRLRAGVFAVFLSMLAVDYFFLPPVNKFVISAAAVTYFVAFVICAIAASWVSSSLKSTQDAIVDARDLLEIRVAERTSELEKSNRELREHEYQLLLLTDAIPQQIWGATPEGAIDSCNRRLLDYVGRVLEQMQGEGFLETIHAEDRENFRSLWREALSAGKPFEGEWRVRAGDGEYRWFFTRAVPLVGQEGKILRWYGTNTDIEGRHRADQALKHTQAEVAYLSRVLSMGELTASIAHEISQPLTAVVSHGQACIGWLAAQPPNLDRIRHTVDRIVHDGTRAGAVLKRITARYGKEAPARCPLDLNEVIHDVSVLLRDESIQRHVSVRMELAAHLPQINGDRAQLPQVLLNLMMNGMDAMTGTDGRVKEIIVSSRREGTEKVVVSVEDRGTGIPAEGAEKMFDPFFSTKPRGMGMGLSISRSIVESHEGRLWVSDRPSGGMIVQFEIPIRATGAAG